MSGHKTWFWLCCLLRIWWKLQSSSESSERTNNRENVTHYFMNEIKRIRLNLIYFFFDNICPSWVIQLCFCSPSSTYCSCTQKSLKSELQKEKEICLNHQRRQLVWKFFLRRILKMDQNLHTHFIWIVLCLVTKVC